MTRDRRLEAKLHHDRAAAFRLQKAHVLAYAQGEAERLEIEAQRADALAEKLLEVK